jgi:hypothetical protein
LEFEFLLVDIGILIYTYFNSVQIYYSMNCDIQICTRGMRDCTQFLVESMILLKTVVSMIPDCTEFKYSPITILEHPSTNTSRKWNSDLHWI